MPPTEETEEPAAPPLAPPARYRITAPGPVCGGVMGVGFANGLAIIEDPVQHARALVWFRAEPGYTVTELDPPEAEAGPVPEPTTEPELAEESAATEQASITEAAAPPTVRRGK